jgi:hypothetical protein
MNEQDVYWVPMQVAGKTLVGHNVYRHITPLFGSTDPGVVKLNTSLVGVPLWRDLTLDMTRKQQFYYLVTQVFSDASEIPLDRPVNIDEQRSNLGSKFKNHSMSRIFTEWKRRKYKILERTSEKVQVLIQRTSGPRCDCFDPKYEQPKYGNCTECYGTGFLRGYELINDVSCRVLKHTEVLKLQPQGLVLNANPKGWLVDFPLFRNGDVIARRNGRRYEVNSVDYIIHQDVLTEQTFELVQLPDTHVVYSFVINGAS